MYGVFVPCAASLWVELISAKQNKFQNTEYTLRGRSTVLELEVLICCIKTLMTLLASLSNVFHKV